MCSYVLSQSIDRRDNTSPSATHLIFIIFLNAILGPMKPPKPSDTQIQKPQINSSGPTQVLMPMGKYKGNTDDDKNNNKMPPQMPPPDKTKMFMGAMDGISCVAVHDLVRAFDLRHHRNAVDLGGTVTF